MPSAPPISPTPPPTDLDTATRLRVAIGRLSRRLRITAAGSEAGLTPTRISVLLSVDRDGPIRIAELSERESLNPTMLSRAISKLVDDDALERVCDDGDRRAAWVNVTDAGHRLAERMRRERTDAVNRALAELGPDERDLLERALPALEGLADQLSERRS